MECSSTRSINGIRVARLGDLVWCPRCKRVTKIITSRFPQVTENGVPSAFDMDITDCGAQLFSRFNDYAGYGSDAPLGRRPRSVSPTSSAPSPRPASGPNVQEHFVFQDTQTGGGVAGLNYTVSSDDGRMIEGETDDLGQTGLIWTGSPVGMEVELGPAMGQSVDPYHYSETSSEDN